MDFQIKRREKKRKQFLMAMILLINRIYEKNKLDNSKKNKNSIFFEIFYVYLRIN